jgi:hypothetical protein
MTVTASHARARESAAKQRKRCARAKAIAVTRLPVSSEAGLASAAPGATTRPPFCSFATKDYSAQRSACSSASSHSTALFHPKTTPP